MTTWVMGMEQMASLLMSGELPDFDPPPYLPDVDDIITALPDNIAMQPAIKKTRLGPEVGWTDGSAGHLGETWPSWHGKLPARNMQSPQQVLANPQAPRPQLSRELLLQKQRELQRQQQLLQLQQAQVQQELLEQDLGSGAVLGMSDRVSSAPPDEQQGCGKRCDGDGWDAFDSPFCPSLWTDELTTCTPALWIPPPVIDGASIDSVRPPSSLAHPLYDNIAALEFYPGSEPLGYVQGPEPEAGIGEDCEPSGCLPSLPELPPTEPERSEAPLCDIERTLGVEDKLLDLVTAPSEGEVGLSYWEDVGESTEGWLKNPPVLEANPQTSTSSASGSHVGGRGGRSSSSRDTPASMSSSGSQGRLESKRPLENSSGLFSLLREDLGLVPAGIAPSPAPVVKIFESRQRREGQQLGFHTPAKLLSGTGKTLSPMEEVKAMVQSLQARRKQEQQSSKPAGKPGSALADRIAAIVRKRRALPDSWQGGCSLGENMSPVDACQVAIRGTEARGCLPSRRCFVVPAGSPVESIPRPAFASAKEAILRSLGVDTVVKGGDSWPSLDCRGGDEMAVVQHSIPPQVLRNTVLTLAEAIATDDQERATLLTGFLKEEASPEGSGIQRISHVFVEALVARRQNSAAGLYVKPFCFGAELTDCLWGFVSKLPCLQFWMEGIAGTVYEAVKDHDRIHIVDFANWACQWKPVLCELAKRPGGPPQVRLTAVVRPVGTPSGLGPTVATDVIRGPLVSMAEEWGIPFEFAEITTRMEDFRPSMLEMREGEVVAVNCALRLAQLMDASVIRWSPRDAVLQTIRDLNPCVVTMGEQNFDSNGPFFLARVKESFDQFAMLFESHEVLADRGDPGRRVFERNVMQREVVNLVACEGINRVVRHEPPSKWQPRMWRAGFVARPFSSGLVDFVRNAAQRRDTRFDAQIVSENGSLGLTYKGHPFAYVLAWQPFLRALPALPSA